jgi:hypothetical protein
LTKPTKKAIIISKSKIEPITITKPNGIIISKEADEAHRNEIPTEMNIQIPVNKTNIVQINETPIKEPEKQDIYFKYFKKNLYPRNNSRKKQHLQKVLFPTPITLNNLTYGNFFN